LLRGAGRRRRQPRSCLLHAAPHAQAAADRRRQAWTAAASRPWRVTHEGSQPPGRPPAPPACLLLVAPGRRPLAHLRSAAVILQHLPCPGRGQVRRHQAAQVAAQAGQPVLRMRGGGVPLHWWRQHRRVADAEPIASMSTGWVWGGRGGGVLQLPLGSLAWQCAGRSAPTPAARPMEAACAPDASCHPHSVCGPPPPSAAILVVPALQCTRCHHAK